MNNPRAGQALRASIVAPAERSPAALEKVHTKLTKSGIPRPQLTHSASGFSHPYAQPGPGHRALVSDDFYTYASPTPRLPIARPHSGSVTLYPEPDKLACAHPTRSIHLLALRKKELRFRAD